jgi:hypothetical protein
MPHMHNIFREPIWYLGIWVIGLNELKSRYSKTWDITTENQISVEAAFACIPLLFRQGRRDQ